MCVEKRLGLAGFLSVLMLSLPGCDPSAFQMFKNAPGTYRGFLIERSLKQTHTTRVQAVCAEAAGSGIECELTAQDEPRAWTFGVDPTGLKSAVLTLSQDFGPTIQTENKISDLKDNCFETEEAQIRFCYDGYEISIDHAPMFSLVLDRVTEDRLPPLEAPEAYTLPQLIKKARDRSFESRLQFEQVIQGRLAAHQAHMALLPRITLGDVLGIAQLNWQSIVRSAGNLAPFLFPSRWIRAQSAEMGFRSDQMAWLAVRANTAQIAETLGLAILRDEESLKIFSAAIPNLEILQQRFQQAEWMGTEPVGSSDAINAVLLSVRRTHLLLAATVQDEKTALAQTLGLVNPLGVKSVSLPASYRFGTDLRLSQNFDQIREDALLRSVELRQMDFLIREAELERRARTYDWIDFASANGGFGFETRDYVTVARNTIEELKLRRSQLQALVIRKVDDVRRELMTSLAANGLAQDSLALHSRRLERIELQHEMGFTISLLEWQSIVQEKLRAELEAISTRYGAQGALSRLNRVLFVEDYLDLRPAAARD